MTPTRFDPARDTPDAVLEQAVSIMVWLLVLAGIPGALLFAAVEYRHGHGTPALAAHAATQLVGLLALLATRRRWHRLRSSLLVAYALPLLILSVMQFGFVMGVGLVLTASATWAGLTLGNRGTLFVAISQLLALAGVALAVHAGWISAPVPGVVDTRLPENWVRYGVASTAGVAALGWLVVQVLSGLERTVGRAEEAAVAHEAERSARERTERDLSRAIRVEAVGRLAASVGNELTDVLARVAGAAAELKTRCDPSQLDLVREVEDAARSAGMTASQLSSLSSGRVEPGGASEVTSVLRPLVASLARTLPPAIELRATFGPQRRVALSALALDRAVMQVCSAVCEALASGGSLELRTEPVDEGALAGGVRIAIDGEPVAPSNANDCGTGELEQARALIEAVGGSWVVERTPGATRARIALPPAALPERAATTSPRPIGADETTILIVDDDPQVQRVMVRVLQRAKYQVLPTAGADEALALLAERAKISLLIVDAGLDGDGARRSIDAYRSRQPDGPVMICTGHAASELAERGLLVPASEYVGKPFTGPHLLAAVSRLLLSSSSAPEAPSASTRVPNSSADS